ncbi:hypothetical protein F5Y09DRAFT_345285 [Xylaria sp. FL1042]|nr:hypothetical protein F5Y09DRAFT_345285 [Xylaria sp. FL1042]
MDTDLLAVGSWVDDRVLNQFSTSWSRRKEGEEHRLDLGNETHLPGSGLDSIGDAKSSRQIHNRRHAKSNDQFLDWARRNASKEVRATQTIQKQHCHSPVCLLDGEQRRQGNKATAKLPGSLSRVEQRLLKQASTPLLLDGYECKNFPNPENGGTEH